MARALKLTDAERDHSFRLARLNPPTGEQISDHIPPGVQRVVARLGDAAAAVFAADWQLIWWNPQWAALLGDPSAAPVWRRNFARDAFPISDEPRALSHWPLEACDEDATKRAMVSDLRRATGRFPADRRLAALVGELSAGNAEFAALWAAGIVGTHREDHKIVRHPSVGPIALDCDVLTDGDAELKIVILTAPPETGDETRLRLAAVAGIVG